ncbi:hypothetical protein MKEN_00638400 [Mycena kentingensis (nom. inval.)]|nr:hypothetical protein MKEN_00638400 [Mycena kentingensis (nom. inval.)]
MRPSFTLSLLLSFSIAGANELRRSPIPGTNALRLALQHTPSSNVSLLFVDPGSLLPCWLLLRRHRLLPEWQNMWWDHGWVRGQERCVVWDRLLLFKAGQTTATHTTVDIDTDFSFTVPALTTPSFVVPSFTVPSLTLPTFPDTIVISLPTNFPTALPNPALPDTTPVGSALSTRVGAGGWMCLSVGIMAGLLQLAF